MRRRCQGTLPAQRPRDRGLALSPDLKGSAGSATSLPACYRDSGDPEKLLKGLPSASDRAGVCIVERHLHAAAPKKRRAPILQQGKLRTQRPQGPQRVRDGFRVQIPFHNNGKNTKNHSS